MVDAACHEWHIMAYQIIRFCRHTDLYILYFIPVFLHWIIVKR